MTLPDFSLEGKVAIVTGAKRSIGRGIALTFAEAGADVAVCGRSLPELASLVEEIESLGRRAVAVQTDVTVKTDVERLVNKTVEAFDTVDVLVNNAVVYANGPLTKLSESQWDSTIDVGLKGFYLCCQAVSDIMIQKQKGCIINLGSTAGIRPTGNQGAYSIIKAGGMMMTKLLAAELAEFNIRVNALAPTVVKTPELMKAIGSSEDALKGFKTQLPLGRLTELEELTSAALYLASDAASYISGHVLVVDGGRINTFPRP